MNLMRSPTEKKDRLVTINKEKSPFKSRKGSRKAHDSNRNQAPINGVQEGEYNHSQQILTPIEMSRGLTRNVMVSRSHKNFNLAIQSLNKPLPLHRESVKSSLPQSIVTPNTGRKINVKDLNTEQVSTDFLRNSDLNDLFKGKNNNYFNVSSSHATLPEIPQARQSHTQRNLPVKKKT